MSADTHTHTHQLMSYELVYTSIHSSIIIYLRGFRVSKNNIGSILCTSLIQMIQLYTVHVNEMEKHVVDQPV